MDTPVPVILIQISGRASAAAVNAENPQHPRPSRIGSLAA